MKHLAIAAAAFSLSAGIANAATILDTTDTGGFIGGLTLGSFGPVFQTEPIGQTFTLTADTENLMAGGFLKDVNETSSPTFEVTISVYDGNNFAAPILGSQTFTLPDGFNAVQLADFSGLGTLSAGTYSLGFSSVGVRGSLRNSALQLLSTDTLDANGLFAPSSGNDLAVLVTGDPVGAAAVPLPAAFPLLGAGLFGLGALTRRKRST